MFHPLSLSLSPLPVLLLSLVWIRWQNKILLLLHNRRSIDSVFEYSIRSSISVFHSPCLTGTLLAKTHTHNKTIVPLCVCMHVCVCVCVLRLLHVVEVYSRLFHAKSVSMPVAVGLSGERYSLYSIFFHNIHRQQRRRLFLDPLYYLLSLYKGSIQSQALYKYPEWNELSMARHTHTHTNHHIAN